MRQFQNDKNRKARGGKSRVLDVSCEHCGKHLTYYQKDGPGLLKRMYLDRFIDTNPSGIQLICTKCRTVLGRRIHYKMENRSAYRLYVGAVHKKIVSKDNETGQRNEDTARDMLVRANAIDASRLPEKIALYESGLALYPDDPELVAQLSFGLAQTFFRDKAYRLAAHRLGEALHAAESPAPELLELQKQLDAVDVSQVPAYPEAFVRIDAPEFRRMTYSVERLWQLDVPTRRMPLSCLEFHLSLPYWATPGKHLNLSPQEVIQNPAMYPHEYQRIVDADLAYPIDACLWEGKWMILDGLHRLAKYKMLDQEDITVRDVPLDLLKAISTVFED